MSRSIPASVPLAEVRASAARGEAAAQLELASRYYTGKDVAQDYEQAAQWYRRAADQGLASAQVNMAAAYASGQGVPQDDEQSAQWYRRAADKGEDFAQFKLGEAYAGGQGVPKDYVEAHKWLNLAASRVSGEEQKKNAGFRDALARLMTADQVAEAQKRAADWQAAFERRKR